MKTSKLAFLGLLTSLALVLSFVEHLLPPLTIAFPGIKMGLPNIVIMLALYRMGIKEAAIVNFSRVIIASLLFGSVQTLAFSLAGAALGLLTMALMKRFTSFSYLSVSVVGGVFHNIGQIGVACLMLETAQIIYYLPVLLISGTVAGILVGLASGFLEKRAPKFNF